MKNKPTPKNVFLLGLVSLLTDISSEMIFPIVPFFLTAVIGASTLQLGFIEGIAALVLSVVSPISGLLSDSMKKHKLFSVSGYFISTLGKFLLIIPLSWLGVLMFRMIDRFGKGIRTSPRDALISHSVSEIKRGKYFGIHRTLDTVGAIVGVLLLIMFLYFFGNDQKSYRIIFTVALIPAVIAVLIHMFFVSDQKIGKKTQGFFPSNPLKLWTQFPKKFKTYAIVIGIFGIAQLSYPFFLLRAKETGISIILVPVFYLIMNIFYAALSVPSGLLSDKIGKKRVLMISLITFVFALLGFALLPAGKLSLWIIFPIYGIFLGFFDVVSRAYVPDLVNTYQQASAFGIIGMIEAITLFIGNAIAGILWYYFGSAYSFLWGVFVTSIILVLVYFFIEPDKRINVGYKFEARKFRFYR